MPPIQPVHYDLYINPDLERFIFEAVLKLDIKVGHAVEEIALNALELDIQDCHFLKGEDCIDLAFDLDARKETLTLRLPGPTAGEIRLEIRYQGQINDRMAGFYRSRYRTATSEGFIAVTQFQESDARRAFPCMDHPARKARFSVTMEIDPALNAISNNAVAETVLLDNGKKRVVFEPTPRMSTYLVFFGVGPFEYRTHTKDQRVRIAVLPGQMAYAGVGLDFGRKALAYSEDVYGIAYPLSKMDLIAVPDFAFGAMENWGAITFRENLLLHYPGTTSTLDEERICEVIAHEIAHQWFGNLVTPAEWKYLWLNESFATYFGFGAVDHVYPEWGIWDRFLLDETATAMARDGLKETLAIEIPGGEHVVINASTAPIIYNKGGSVLRQIQGYIGDTHYRDGLRAYLRKHAYKTAESTDLWDAFGQSAQLPVAEMIKTWVEQPGFPVVNVARAGDSLTLSQKRFTYLENDSEQVWQIPVDITCFDAHGKVSRVDVLMTEATHTVDLPPDTAYYLVNQNRTGFYRIYYEDAENLEHLKTAVSRLELTARARWGIQDDLFAFLKNGRIAPGRYLDFLKAYENETAYLPVAGVAQHLATLFLLAPARYRKKLTAFSRPWFEGIFERTIQTSPPDQAHNMALAGNQLLWQGVLAGSERLTAFARARFEELMAGDEVSADIARSVLQAGANSGPDDTFDRLTDQLARTESEHQRMNILYALGSFGTERLLARAFVFTLEKVPPRNQFLPLAVMAENPAASELLWSWFMENEPVFWQFHPLHYERVLTALIPVAGLYENKAVKDFCEHHLARTDLARDAILLSLERLEINQRLHDALSAENV